MSRSGYLYIGRIDLDCKKKAARQLVQGRLWVKSLTARLSSVFTRAGRENEFDWRNFPECAIGRATDTLCTSYGTTVAYTY